MPYLTKRKISAPSYRKENEEKKNKKWQKYYGCRAWKSLRDYYKKLRPLCYDCALEGRSVPADDIHHKIPWSWFADENDRFAALLDVDNLIPLCKKHHLERHKYLKRPENFENTPYYKKIHNH